MGVDMQSESTDIAQVSIDRRIEILIKGLSAKEREKLADTMSIVHEFKFGDYEYYKLTKRIRGNEKEEVI